MEKALQNSFMKERKREFIFFMPNPGLTHNYSTFFVQNVAEKTEWRKATTAAREEKRV